jgi:ATP-dependent Clp protease ATP-binding subunit ClpA
MDHGRLTDHNGKQVNFRNVILIMTTNAGAADLARQAFGFTRNKREGDDHEAINRQFAPEFRNRLDAIISFAHLNAEVIGMVVRSSCCSSRRSSPTVTSPSNCPSLPRPG